jgi:hypothetical protein
MNFDPTLRSFATSRHTAWRTVAAALLVFHWAWPGALQTVGSPARDAPSFSTGSRGAQIGAPPRAMPGAVKIEAGHAVKAPKAWSVDDDPDALPSTAAASRPSDRSDISALQADGQRPSARRAFDPRAPPS